MLVRVGGSNDVAAGAMRVFDVAGTKVNVASVSGRLYAFDDACTHQGCSLATSATRLVAAASGNTAGIVGAARVSKRGRGFRKHRPVSGDRGPKSGLPVDGAADEKRRQRNHHDQGQDADDRPRSLRKVIRIARRLLV